MKKKSLILIAFITTLVTCKKPEPTIASFTSDKDNYTSGDTIHLRNTSQNAKYFKWSAEAFGMNSNTKDWDFIVDGDGDYEIKLNASSGRNSSEAKKTIRVKPPQGDVIFYTNTSIYGEIDVYIYSVFIGKITSPVPIIPSCGTPGCYSTQLAEGYYTLTANSKSGKNWYYPIFVYKNMCNPFVLN